MQFYFCLQKTLFYTIVIILNTFQIIFLLYFWITYNFFYKNNTCLNLKKNFFKKYGVKKVFVICINKAHYICITPVSEQYLANMFTLWAILFGIFSNFLFTIIAIVQSNKRLGHIKCHTTSVKCFYRNWETELTIVEFSRCFLYAIWMCWM